MFLLSGFFIVCVYFYLDTLKEWWIYHLQSDGTELS